MNRSLTWSSRRSPWWRKKMKIKVNVDSSWLLYFTQDQGFLFDSSPLRCMPLLPLFYSGTLYKCIFVDSLLFNKARSLLTAWGRVLCNSATDSASLMNCLAGLVNRWSRSSSVMESQSTPKRVSYRELTTLQMRWSRAWRSRGELVIRGGASRVKSNQRLRKLTQWCGVFERRCKLWRHPLI